MDHVNYDHRGHYSCMLLALDSMSTVRLEPYRLACGETLQVGDKFTRLGKRASAGFPDILLATGWYQQFEGLVTTDHFNDPLEDLEWVLFSAWHESGANALDGLEMQYPNTFIAYHSFMGGQLHFYTKAIASRLVNCALLERKF